jgi:formate dehydrogenase iron-sulfur subunit
VVIQASACNGCRACIPACPFSVIGVSGAGNIAQKCTLCYDRLKEGLVPSCAQACPTQSIAFGPVKDLRERAEARVKALHVEGRTDAYIYGDEKILGGLNSFYLLIDKPEVYGLPANPQLPSRNLAVSSIFSVASAALVGIAALVGLRGRRSTSPIPGAPTSAENGDSDGSSAV